MDSFYFSINFRINRFSISINPNFIEVEKWGDSYFDNESIFRYDFKQKNHLKPKPKSEFKPLENADDDDFDLIPF